MHIQSALSSPVHVPSTTTPSRGTPLSKPFSEHVGAARETSSARTVTATGSSTESASAAPSGTSGTAATASSPNTSSVQSSLDQSQDQNMQYLQLQTQVNDQSETFTTLSNVMKTENDTLKNTAANMAM